jgi:hypothetical protein
VATLVTKPGNDNEENNVKREESWASKSEENDNVSA